MRIPLASSGLRKEDIEAAIATLNSGSLTMGVQVKEFERDVAQYLKVNNFVMMNSGSSANLSIFEALLRPSKKTPRLQKGDGVLVPAVAWPTTIWPIVQLGLEPIFVDVDLHTLAIDLVAARKVIAHSKIPIKAIFPIHPLGYSLDHFELAEFCKSTNLVLINDVCESLGSWRGSVHAGTTGLASSFSFYFSHHITTMEGGGVATNDEEFADDLRSIRSHGWSRDRKDVDEWTNQVSETDSKFLFVTTGYNIRPMEIQAAIGRLQIRDIDTFVTKRRSIAKRVYNSLINESINVVDANSFSNLGVEETHSWMLIPISILGENRNQRKIQILNFLEQNSVETRPVLTGNFLAQPSMNRIDGNHPPASNFPNASEISNSYFMVGAHHDLSENQIEYLITTLVAAARKYDS